MTHRKQCFIVVATLLLASLSIVAYGQVPKRQMATTRTANPNMPASPDYSLKVDFDTRLLDSQAKIHRQVKDRLNLARIGIPDDRVRYFRTVIHPDSVLVSGWRGMIHSITPVDGGVVVELKVTAVQSGMADTATLIERYSILNEDVHYMGAYVPKNIARFAAGF